MLLTVAEKGIHWALPLLEEILSPELYVKMQKCHTDPFHAISDDDYSQAPIMHGVTGEILKPSSRMKMPRVSRYRTRQWLLEALPKGSAQVYLVICPNMQHMYFMAIECLMVELPSVANACLKSIQEKTP